MRLPRSCRCILALLAPIALAACVSGVNGSVDVPAGSSVDNATTVNGSVNLGAKAKAGRAATVNGRIRLGEGAEVGSAKTVNGGITLAARAIAGSVTTVNGAVTLDHNATVSGDVEAVNGALSLASGAAVKGRLLNVNSHITVDGAHVGAGITTVNGDIDVLGNAVVDGGITVRKPKNDSGVSIHLGSDDVPVITIGPGATVNGPLTFEREVKLYLSEDAHVAGPITGATPIRFKGPMPRASALAASAATSAQ